MLDENGLIKVPAGVEFSPFSEPLTARLRTFMMWLKGRDRDLRYTLSLHLPTHSDPQ